MNLPPILELAYLGVADAGVPNKERIVLRPTERVNLARCAVLLGWRTSENRAWLFPDYMFWFGGLVVEPPSWIFIYTGKGEFKETTTLGGNQTAYVFHWGQPKTLFSQDSQLIPVVVRFDAILLSGLHADSTQLPILMSDLSFPGLLEP